METSCGCGTGTKTPCCPPPPSLKSRTESWIAGSVESAIGPIPTVSTRLTWHDRLGAWKVRWDIGRMGYSVPPGLYAVGRPTPGSPVLVTANYKLSLDALRRELRNVDAWLLILDTRGINVWCAAGKGTFGTDELSLRIVATRLSEVVHHRRLILPQLGAPGVAAHVVLKRTGFSIQYGPVRAHDLPTYLDHGGEASEAMRRVEFGLMDRLTVVPVEIVQAWKVGLGAGLFLAVLAALGREHWVGLAAQEAVLFTGAFLAGTVLTAALLPWLPFRFFSAKGFVLGLVWAVVGVSLFPNGALEDAGSLFFFPAISSFLAMNFTGASTFTSPTGAVREVRLATPILAMLALTGAVLKLIATGLALS